MSRCPGGGRAPGPRRGISCEVIDLRTLIPLDEEGHRRFSIAKTTRLMIVEDGRKRGRHRLGGGRGWVAENHIDLLDAPIVPGGGHGHAVCLSPLPWRRSHLPGQDDILTAARRIVE